MADARRRHDPVPCPDPLHAGSKVKSVDTRRASSGLRRDYLCRPTVGKRHKFTALIEVDDEPVPLYVPPPKCPVHGAQGRRVRNGTYGTPGEPTRRQRYRCWPDKPDPDFPKGFHNFTPPLAREHVPTGESHCQACEELRNVHHGEQVAARAQSWNLRVVAEGLEKLASSAETYSSVGRWAWEATGRSRTRPAKLSDAEREGRAKVARVATGSPGGGGRRQAPAGQAEGAVAGPAAVRVGDAASPAGGLRPRAARPAHAVGTQRGGAQPAGTSRPTGWRCTRRCCGSRCTSSCWLPRPPSTLAARR